MFPSDDLDVVQAWDAYMKQGDPTHHCSNCRAQGYSSRCETCGAAATSIPEPHDMDDIEGVTAYVMEVRDGEVHYRFPDEEDTPDDENP